MSDLLACRNVCKQYLEDGMAPVSVLEGVSFTIGRGERVAILGSSGSGKSTLLHLLGALDKPTSGQVLFNGEDIFAFSEARQAQFRNQSLGFVYQFHHLLPEFTALENVAMPLLIAKIPPSDAKQRAESILKQVGLSHRLSHQPAKLSGGERQRVAIARALVSDPALVLADEPTGNLDKKTGDGIYDLLSELKESLSTSFVVVTHDVELANGMDRVLTLSEGKLRETQQ